MNLLGTADEDEFREMEFYTENGQKIANQIVIDTLNTLDSIVRKAEKYESINDCSFNKYITDSFEIALANLDKYKNESIETKAILEGICQWRCKFECIENGCSDLDSLSVKYFGSYVELDGIQAVELKFGFKAIIDSLIKKSDENKFYSKLKLNHRLKRILVCESLFENNKNYCEHCLYTNEKNKIVVFIENKIENKIIAFICKHVICTMSLGVLKANFNEIFLNYKDITTFNEKYNSISRLGYGTVNKIYLIYEEPFWDENSLGIQLVWQNELNDKNKKWYKNIVGFERVKNHDSILLGWLFGCEDYENLSDEIVQKDCTDVLMKFLSRSDIPNPIKIIRYLIIITKSF